MELWFLLSVLSAILGGLFIFITKIAAERNYDVVLMSTASLTASAALFFFATLIFSDFTGFSRLMLVVAIVNSASYMWVNILRHNAMQCIDTAIYYPIYKTITPALTIIAGIFLFAETFTPIEWIGLVLSLLVPLLLISKAEKSRQKDLVRGLRLLLGAAFLAVIATISIKYGTDGTENTWLFIFLTDLGVAVAGMTILLVQKTKQPLIVRLQKLKNTEFLSLIAWMSVFQVTGFATMVFAIAGGPLGIVYTINSLYILIPIVLSIIFYNEHWNARKIAAIILSIAALGLLH